MRRLNTSQGHPDPEVEEQLRAEREEHEAHREEVLRAYAEKLRQHARPLRHTPILTVEEREAAEADAQKLKARKRAVSRNVYREF